jgi:MFS family permease
MNFENIKSLLANKSFKRYYFALLISLFGDWFSFVAISDFLLKIDSNKSVIAYLMIFHLLPFVIFSPFAGSLADKISRKKILYFSDAMRFFIVITVIISVQFESVWLILSLLFLQYTFSSLYEPALSSLLPNIVSNKNLYAANSAVAAAWSIMMSLGMGLGGIVVFLSNTETALIIDSLTFLCSFLLMRSVVVNETHMNGSYRFTLKDLFPLEDYKQAYRYMRQKLFLIPIVLSKAVLEISVGAFVFFLTIYGETKFAVLGSTALGIGILQSARGIGTGIGPIIARRLFKTQKSEYISLSVWLLVIPISYFFVSLQSHVFFVILFVIIAHIGGGANWVVSENLIHELVEDKYRGRIISFEFAAMTLVMSSSIRLASFGLDKEFFSLNEGTQYFAYLGIIVAFLWFILSKIIYKRSNAKDHLIELR